MDDLTPRDDPRDHLRQLGLWGLLANWSEVHDQPWLTTVIDLEICERQRRSLERRIKNARLGSFKPFADFDWKWPTSIDQNLLRELFSLDFIVSFRQACKVAMCSSGVRERAGLDPAALSGIVDDRSVRRSVGDGRRIARVGWLGECGHGLLVVPGHPVAWRGLDFARVA